MKVQFKLQTVVNISVIKLLLIPKEVTEGRLVQQGVIQHPEYIESASSKFAVMLHDGHKTICDDCNVYLYSHRILSVAPEGPDSKMLLYPAEEKFYLPSLLIEHGHIPGLELKVIGQESEGSFQLRCVIDNPAQIGWIFLLGLVSGKTDCLVKEYVISIIRQFSSVNNLILESGFLTDYEVGTYSGDGVQPGQIIISLVKDVERVWLIWNVIHSVHVMDFGLRNMYVLRYLSDHIEKGVNLDSAFSFSETGPFVQAQAQIYCGGVECVELSIQNKFAVYSLGLSQCNHVISEFFEKPVIPVGIGIFQSTSGNDTLAKAEMVTFILMGCNDTNQFPKAVTSGQLSEHHQQELVPARHGLGPLICIITLHHLIKLFLWQEFHELTEYVFSAIHVCLSQFQATMIQNQFKSFSLKIAANLLCINN